MNLPQLLHSTRSYGRANSAFSWKLLVLERGFLSYRLKLPSDRSEKDAWSGYSPAGALRKLPFILYSRPAERNRAGQLQLRAVIVRGSFRVVAEVVRRNNWMPMSR